MPRYCWEPDCDKQSNYNYPGRTKPIFCKTHADLENGMVDVSNVKCKNNCGKQAQNGDYCRTCFNENQGIVHYVGENILKNYLKERFLELCLKTEFYILTYKIDFLLELEELFIAIEHDENQHKHSKCYPIGKEAKREKEIFEELMREKRSVLIRFNPSNYRIGKKLMKTPLKERFEKLGDFITECIFDETKSGIFRLFYDE